MSRRTHEDGDCGFMCRWCLEEDAEPVAEDNDCGSCPFAGCDDCRFAGGVDPVVAQANPVALWDNGGSKTAPGDAPTSTGSLARSEAAKPHGRTCI